MADILTPAQRYKCMSAVRRENTVPEKLIRSILHKAGLRYRLHDKNLPGSPDLVFPCFHAVLFVHGCYWHRHGCYKSTVPKLRRDLWEEKFVANKERDARSVRSLRDSGWRVMIVWECALKGKTSYPADKIASAIKEWLRSSGTFTQIPKAVNSQAPVVSGILEY